MNVFVARILRSTHIKTVAKTVVHIISVSIINVNLLTPTEIKDEKAVTNLIV